MGTKEVGGDLVAAASRREQFDHLVVGDRDDEHRDAGCDRQVQAEVTVLAERQKCLLGSVAGGGKPVRAEADPGQKGHQHHVPPRLLAERVERRAEDDLGYFPSAWHRLLPGVFLLSIRTFDWA